jgi:hypothetical protein
MTNVLCKEKVAPHFFVCLRNKFRSFLSRTLHEFRIEESIENVEISFFDMSTILLIGKKRRVLFFSVIKENGG